MPKKEICIKTGIELSIEKVFNFASPEQVYDKLVKISEEAVKPFKKKFGEPSRLLFKTRKYATDTVVEVHFMRVETDEEFEKRMIDIRVRRKIAKLEIANKKVTDAKVEKIVESVTNHVKSAIKMGIIRG